jgi:microtubule-associated protein-like 6
MPREEELEVKAMHCFEAVLAGEGDSGGGSGKVYIGRVIEWAADDPEVKSWLDYFDDAPERDWVVYPMQRLELDFESEGAHPTKTASEAADMGMDPFVFNEPANVKMAKQGWTNAIASLQPTAYADSRPDLSVPDTSLELEWVHGYRSEDAKSNVRYTASGEMVWHASRVGVIYNALEHRQVRGFGGGDGEWGLR